MPARARSKAPSEEDVRRRAYELYLARGQVPGHEAEDWDAAVRELTAGPAGRTPGKAVPKTGAQATATIRAKPDASRSGAAPEAGTKPVKKRTTAR